MFVVTVRLRRAPAVSVTTAPQLRRAIASSALPAERLEHVYAEVDDQEAGIVLFLLSPDLQRAETAAAGLIGRATRERLRGWETVTCQAELIAGFAERSLPPD